MHSGSTTVYAFTFTVSPLAAEKSIRVQHTLLYITRPRASDPTATIHKESFQIGLKQVLCIFIKPSLLDEKTESGQLTITNQLVSSVEDQERKNLLKSSMSAIIINELIRTNPEI
ncbi:predicted protein [Plenodomus lingam JN3]|uniref:Uncharacterized protein n=1 Tax=Leptosphaeria maculans (strain JN3 / isolate v23.1.3 / race Av1-4-5-6-7-8) TaxID=985895 RepID=E4ZGN2_LEPMJ|nr:predicted protein [Plenodomus lingam JN3]CBX90452.1 predicted protein [Plenodomus lingam JN3]